jgi:hypothetical protein
MKNDTTHSVTARAVFLAGTSTLDPLFVVPTKIYHPRLLPKSRE